MGAGRIIFIIGAVFIMLSMLIPWVEIKEANVKMLGYETDGIIAGIIGVAALVIGITYKNTRSDKPYFIWGILGSLIACGLISNMYIKMIRIFKDTYSFLNYSEEFAKAMGMGIYIAGLGSLLLLIGSIIPTPKSENEEAKISESPNVQNKKD